MSIPEEKLMTKSGRTSEKKIIWLKCSIKKKHQHTKPYMTIHSWHIRFLQELFGIWYTLVGIGHAGVVSTKVSI